MICFYLLLFLALPNSQHFSSQAESKPSSSPPPTKKYQSYAKAVKASTRISLLHDEFIRPDLDVDMQIPTFQSRIFRASRSPNAMLFDINFVKTVYNDDDASVVVANQHPQVYACASASDGPKRYLEVYAESAADQIYLQEQGLLFSKSKLSVLPCKVIQDFSKIVHLKLSRLPLVPAKAVLDGLKSSLVPFGTIPDVGILTSPQTKHFMGLGYAVLDTSLSSAAEEGCLSTKPHQLTHVINWCEEDDSFLAMWNNMPMGCRYCHKEGHTNFECELSKANLICYNCHQKGHRPFECPQKHQRSFAPHKKPCKTPAAPASPTTRSPSPPSTEILKSQYAPKTTILNAQFLVDNEVVDPTYVPEDESMSNGASDDESDRMSDMLEVFARSTSQSIDAKTNSKSTFKSAANISSATNTSLVTSHTAYLNPNPPQAGKNLTPDVRHQPQSHG
ncbi:MAG: hypothetical protein EXX96DRAFT_552137 [Benjaminiella poitrasii]|nr:MAG: hypothetical protein EXX96DRAFT_552137 [Benjaminiella poitrasii]